MYLWSRAAKFIPVPNSKKRFECRKHLEYVASLPCAIIKAGVYTHSGGVQVHHLLKPWSGNRGMGMRSNDRNSLPLCFHHHSMLHTKFGNEEKFFEHFGLPKDFGKTESKKLWQSYCSDNDVDDELMF